MTEYTADKQRAEHLDITAGSYRRLLPETLHKAKVVVRQTEHRGRKTNDLVFFHHRGEKKIFRLVLRLVEKRKVILTTLHRVKPADVKRVMAAGDVLRDWR